MNYTVWIDHYGYIFLFIALMLELIIVGIPTEIIMGYVGFLVYEGKLAWIPAIITAGIGTSLGISIAYLIGSKLGYPFFNKYGHKIHMGPDRLDRFGRWFRRYGNGLIILAYFIPGVRHVTGYFSGITKIGFRKFILFAYTGAFLWVTAFISLGKLLGPQWKTFHNETKKYLVIGSILLVAILVSAYLYKKLRSSIITNLKMILTKSPFRARISIFGAMVAFIMLVVLFIGLIQDYLANEFTKFNQITSLIVKEIFGQHISIVMDIFGYFSSLWVLILISFLTITLIIIWGRERRSEILSFFIAILGGFLLMKMLNLIFDWIGPFQSLSQGYPPTSFLSEISLLSLTIWGYFAYVVYRQTHGFFLPSLAMILILIFSLLNGVSRIFFDLDIPSNIVSGYVFAGVWLSLNIMVVDIFRELSRMSQNK